MTLPTNTNSALPTNTNSAQEKCWNGPETEQGQDDTGMEVDDQPSQLKIGAIESAAGNFAYTGAPVSPRGARKLPGQTPSKIPCTGRKRRLDEVDAQAQEHSPVAPSLHSRTCSEESEDAPSLAETALGGASSPWKNMFSDTMLADGLFASVSNPPSAAGSKLPVSRKKQPRQQQMEVSPTPYGDEHRESVKRMKIEDFPKESEVGQQQEEQQQKEQSVKALPDNVAPCPTEVEVRDLTPAKSPVPTHSSTENNSNFTRSPLEDITYSNFKSAPQSPVPAPVAAETEQEPANLMLHAGEVNPFAFCDKSPAHATGSELNGTIKDLIMMPNAMQYGATEAPLFSPGAKETAKPTHKKRRGSLLPMPRGRAKVAMEEQDEEDSIISAVAPRRSSRVSSGGIGNARIKPVANVIPSGATASSRRKSVAPSTSSTCNKVVNDENAMNGQGLAAVTTGGVMQKVQNMAQKVSGN